MGLSERLRTLDARVGTRATIGLRRRGRDEPVEDHLRWLVENGAFGTSQVAEDVLTVLDRVVDLERRMSALEKRG